MIKYIFSILSFFIFISFLRGQEKQLLGDREISIYKVEIKSKEGNFKGNLLQVTPEYLLIEQKEGSKKIAAERLKTIKVKFSQKKNVPVFKNIAQTGLDIISDPEFGQTRTLRVADKPNGEPNYIQENESPLGERLLVGTAVVTGAIIGNELAKLAPQASIEKFKINFSSDKYLEKMDDLAMYSSYLQSSPEYETVLRNRLKAAMEKKKLKI